MRTSWKCSTNSQKFLFKVELTKINQIAGIPKIYESFKVTDDESVLLMERLGDCLFDILEKEGRRSLPI